MLSVGLRLGCGDGQSLMDGIIEGWRLGFVELDGTYEGTVLGTEDAEGSLVGSLDGEEEIDGGKLSDNVGPDDDVGSVDGWKLGIVLSVGLELGDRDGLMVLEGS